MLRLFLLFHLLFFHLFACTGTNNSCIQKINDANTIVNNTLFIPVKNNKRLIYSETPPKEKILKHDPFLGLYLVEDKEKFAYDFDLTSRLNLSRAIVNKKALRQGKLLHSQVGLNTLASFSTNYEAPALFLSSCCSLEGIATQEGIIQKEYLQRFLSNVAATYGDIGVRVQEKGGSVFVSARDPYIKNNPFLKGDKILILNGQKVRTASEFMRKILFAKVGSKQIVRIFRGTKIIDVSVITQKRYGGGKISDTFLESKGIYFDKKLAISSLGKEFREYGLLVGDKLLFVNGVSVKTQEELRKYIEDFKDYSSLLFERNNFQFFVNIK